MGFSVHLMVRTWRIAARKLGYDSCEGLLLPYVVFNDKELQFKVIKSRNEGFSQLSQQHDLSRGGTPTLEEGKVDGKAFSRTSEMDSAIRLLVGFFFETLHLSLRDSRLIALGENEAWPRRNLFYNETQRDKFPEILKRLHADACSVLGWEHVPAPIVSPVVVAPSGQEGETGLLPPVPSNAGAECGGRQNNVQERNQSF